MGKIKWKIALNKKFFLQTSLIKKQPPSGDCLTSVRNASTVTERNNNSIDCQGEIYKKLKNA